MDKKDYKKVFIIMSHDLTRGQVAKLKDMGGKEILLLPPALKELWGNIDAEGELDTQALLPVIHWIEGKARERDLVLIQGSMVRPTTWWTIVSKGSYAPYIQAPKG